MAKATINRERRTEADLPQDRLQLCDKEPVGLLEWKPKSSRVQFIRPPDMPHRSIVRYWGINE